MNVSNEKDKKLKFKYLLNKKPLLTENIKCIKPRQLTKIKDSTNALGKDSQNFLLKFERFFALKF